MVRKFVVGGNWKMNGNKEQIGQILNFLKEGPLNADTEVVIGVPAVYLEFVKNNAPANVEVAAQNCYKAEKGAFTGESTIWCLLNFFSRFYVSRLLFI